MTNSNLAILQFDYPFDERTAEEAADRGFWEHCHVELPNGTKHPIVFYDAVRLAQDLEEEASQGRPFLAERGMVILQDVTKQNMESAVEQLVKEAFFQ
ncbi:hypothetical protein Pan153_30960 [Gimesia panareensis]|uniref:Uncharacterized protein n=2 Tax=Gimesia panareensis TaxID=2527978 RepID=A0A518FQ17_9PLAN|nr:hypothetical protein Pan153_30960 [Gimesia panareensis]